MWERGCTFATLFTHSFGGVTAEGAPGLRRAAQTPAGDPITPPHSKKQHTTKKGGDRIFPAPFPKTEEGLNHF